MSARDRRTCDIARGSTWNARDGSGTALVITVNLGFVVYEDETGRVRTLLGALFRRRFAPPYDVGDRTKGVAQHFRVSRANLASFHAFFVPSTRRMHARSSRKTVAECYLPCRGRGGALPPDAIYVGTYDVAASVDDFLRDLNDELAARRPSADTAA